MPIGWGWASATHDITVMDEAGTRIERFAGGRIRQVFTVDVEPAVARRMEAERVTERVA